MKAKIFVKLKSGILDPQGTTAKKSLHALGYSDIKDVRIGKYIELTLDSTDKSKIDEMCKRLLVNGVIEDYSFEVTA